MTSNQETSQPIPRAPQLQMRRPDLRGLPPVEVPEGYSIRTYQPGDEVAWCRIMNQGLRPPEGGQWTPVLCRERLTRRPQFDPSGLFFATRGDELVGSTCAWTLQPGETEVGYLHMVCVLPEHRGHRLGYWLSLQVLHHLAERGFREARLFTDDFRLAAIQTYLQLGFQPEHSHPSHAERWLLILNRLREEDRLPARPGTAPIAVAPIGLVRNGVVGRKHHGWEDVVSEIHVEPAFQAALDGIEDFSHLTVLFWLSQVSDEQRSIRKLHPRDRLELPLTGVLATHSQYRPNPIGMTTVELLRREGTVLVVKGLDALDGTPVLDVKPWSSGMAPDGAVRLPEWIEKRRR